MRMRPVRRFGSHQASCLVALTEAAGGLIQGPKMRKSAPRIGFLHSRQRRSRMTNGPLGGRSAKSRTRF